METKLTYNDIKIQFPKEVQKLETAIRSKRSKMKNDPFDSFKWGTCIKPQLIVITTLGQWRPR